MDITFESSEKLYNDLVKLVQTNEAFYTTEQELDGVQYIIFNYRMASYTDFCQAGALNARGTMFEVYNGNFIRLVCLPFAKFFNLGETPFTMDLDLSDVDYIADKMDGSMICSYLHTDKLSGEKILKLKTKGSISSD
ncbi:MAG: ligase, partial [Mucilaginibacter sp.]|nr:ligase [Mucilaginibacter sp.]